MNITMLHNDMDALSRGLVAELFPEGLPYRDTLVNWHGHDLRIIADAALASQVFPAYPGCPCFMVEAGPMLHAPGSWDDVLAWAGSVAPPASPSQTRFSRTGFMRLFTVSELDSLIAADRATATGEDDPVIDVQRMWTFLGQSEFISLVDPLTINSLYLLMLGGYITEPRFGEIRSGVLQIPGEVA